MIPFLPEIFHTEILTLRRDAILENWRKERWPIIETACTGCAMVIISIIDPELETIEPTTLCLDCYLDKIEGEDGL